MIRKSAFAMAAALGVATMFAPNAAADQWNKRTILTVNEPIQVPGQTLQPGKYVMRLLDSPSNRHIVQVFNETEQQLITTVLAIPNYRLQPTGDTTFGFYETPAGQPKAMRSWFYPGDNFGQEFVYPKTEAVAIAQYSNTNVPTTTATNEQAMRSAEVTAVDRQGTELALDRETYTRADGQQPQTPAQQPETQVAQNTPAPEPTPAPVAQPEPAAQPEPVAQPEPAQLPETGSPMPLIGMAGLLSLGAAAVLRRMSL